MPRPSRLSPWISMLSVELCVSALVFSGAANSQTLYKCVQPSGRVLYQQEPCADATKQSTVRPPDPPASKTAEEVRSGDEKAAKTAETEVGQVSQMMADLSLCVSDVPGFDAKHSEAIQNWKRRNGPAVARFDKDEAAKAKAVARMDAERARLKADKNPNALAQSCDRIAASLGGPAPAAAARK